MTKIPVGATIAHAYRFGFGNVPAFVKAIWLPTLAQLVVIAIAAPRLLLIMQATQARDPALTSLVGPLLLLFPLALLFFFAQFTAATQTALGQLPQSWIGFHFGKPMWRLMGGFLIALLAILAIALVGMLAVWLVARALDEAVKLAAGARLPVIILSAMLAIAYLCSLVFLAMRLLFLLAPASVSEHRLGAGRAWKLSKGNFWRFLLVTLAIMLPVLLVNYGYEILLAGWPPILPGASAEARKAAEALWRMRQLTAMMERWYFTFPLTILVTLFQYGVGCAAQAFAYRILVAAKSEPAA